MAYHEAIEKGPACGWLVINKTKLLCLEKPIKKHVSLFRIYMCWKWCHKCWILTLQNSSKTTTPWNKLSWGSLEDKQKLVKIGLFSSDSFFNTITIDKYLHMKGGLRPFFQKVTVGLQYCQEIPRWVCSDGRRGAVTVLLDFSSHDFSPPLHRHIVRFFDKIFIQNVPFIFYWL